MEFVSDEDFPLPSTRLLREAGHRVLAVVEEAAGMRDEEVLEATRVARAVLLTMDSDFGELIFRQGLAPPAGIVFFRILSKHAQDPAMRLLEMLSVPAVELRGYMTVVQREGFRQRRLP